MLFAAQAFHEPAIKLNVTAELRATRILNPANVAIAILRLHHRSLQCNQRSGIRRWIRRGILQNAGLFTLNRHACEHGTGAVGQCIISIDLIARDDGHVARAIGPGSTRPFA